MKKFYIWLPVALLLSLLDGCVYESSVPIDTPSIKLNQLLLGSWKAQGESTLGSKTMSGITLTRSSDLIYNIEHQESGKSEISKMKGYLSVINNVTFLNVWDTIPAQAPIGYNIFKIEIEDKDHINIFPLTENIKEKFGSSTDFRKFIAANMMNSYFFEKPYTCVRVDNQ